MTDVEASELEQLRTLLKETRDELHAASEKIVALTKERDEMQRQLEAVSEIAAGVAA